MAADSIQKRLATGGSGGGTGPGDNDDFPYAGGHQSECGEGGGGGGGAGGGQRRWRDSGLRVAGTERDFVSLGKCGGMCPGFAGRMCPPAIPPGTGGAHGVERGAGISFAAPDGGTFFGNLSITPASARLRGGAKAGYPQDFEPKTSV